jgi:alpha-L-fucosidase
VFVNMMKEIFAKYGPIWEFWWDGANGEGPNGKKQEYDWPLFRETIKKLSPNTVVFSDVGPQVRWVGNESGVAGTTNWNLLNVNGFTAGAGAPSADTLNSGNMYGEKWIPAECDVSIRPGWFYHKEEDEKVKTPETLFNLYLKSVGRGSTLLLNVPPDRRGLINQHDSASLMGFRKLREANFKTNLFAAPSAIVKNSATSKRIITLTDGKQNTFEQVKSVSVQFKKPATINTIVLQEPIQLGQRVIHFKVVLQDANGVSVKEISGTTIGRKRILTFAPVMAKKVEVLIEDSKAAPLLSEIAAYNINDQLIEQ